MKPCKPLNNLSTKEVLLGNISKSDSLNASKIKSSIAATSLSKALKIKRKNPNSLLQKKITPTKTYDSEINEINIFNNYLISNQESLKTALISETTSFAKSLQEAIGSLVNTLNRIIPDDDSLNFSVLGSDHPLTSDVDRMLERARNKLPPEKPYIPNEWDSVVDFVKDTYGKYLSSTGAEDDFLYQDQLREIHPDRVKVTLLKRRIKSESTKKSPSPEKIAAYESEIRNLEEQYGTDEWGFDVVKALQNYYQHNKTTSIGELIKGKNDRLDKEREALRNSDAGKRIQQSASRFTYLNYSK